MAKTYFAHVGFRQSEILPLWFGCAGPLIMASIALAQATRNAATWFWIAMLAIGVISPGLWFAKEWARWVAGVVPAVYGLWSLSSLLDSASRLSGLFVFAVMATLSWYAFRPATHRAFVEARESIARARTARS